MPMLAPTVSAASGDGKDASSTLPALPSTGLGTTMTGVMGTGECMAPVPLAAADAGDGVVAGGEVAWAGGAGRAGGVSRDRRLEDRVLGPRMGDTRLACGVGCEAAGEEEGEGEGEAEPATAAAVDDSVVGEGSGGADVGAVPSRGGALPLPPEVPPLPPVNTTAGGALPLGASSVRACPVHRPGGGKRGSAGCMGAAPAAATDAKALGLSTGGATAVEPPAVLLAVAADCAGGGGGGTGPAALATPAALPSSVNRTRRLELGEGDSGTVTAAVDTMDSESLLAAEPTMPPIAGRTQHSTKASEHRMYPDGSGYKKDAKSGCVESTHPHPPSHPSSYIRTPYPFPLHPLHQGVPAREGVAATPPLGRDPVTAGTATPLEATPVPAPVELGTGRGEDGRPGEGADCVVVARVASSAGAGAGAGAGGGAACT
jgi:hypothetical protein